MNAESKNKVVGAREVQGSLDNIRHPGMRAYLTGVHAKVAAEVWPKRVSSLDLPPFPEAFEMPGPEHIRQFLSTIHKIGLVIPESVRVSSPAGRESTIYSYDLDRTLASAAVHFTIHFRLFGTTLQRYRAVNWREAYRDTVERISDTSFAAQLHEPSIERLPELPESR